MYTLRKITGDGVEINFSLGNQYTLVLKESNPEEFQRYYESHLREFYKEGEVYGFVSCGGREIHNLFPRQQNFIMTDNGATFDNLTLK